MLLEFDETTASCDFIPTKSKNKGFTVVGFNGVFSIKIGLCPLLVPFTNYINSGSGIPVLSPNNTANCSFLGKGNLRQ